jgi:lysophospholipase L1-like esterase
MQTQKSTSSIAILNQAAGGNRVLADGLGPNAVGRIDRDVLAQSGVRYVMLFEGVNDIGTAAATSAAQSAVGDRLIAAYQQIIGRVHAAGIPIFAATITPFSSPGFNATVQPYADATREATRQRVNTWIRESGRFDAVVDFDAILRNSSAPSQLDSRYHGGDFLHPNVAGYQLLADRFPLGIFEKFEHGVDGFI